MVLYDLFSVSKVDEVNKNTDRYEKVNILFFIIQNYILFICNYIFLDRSYSAKFVLRFCWNNIHFD